MGILRCLLIVLSAVYATAGLRASGLVTPAPSDQTQSGIILAAAKSNPKNGKTAPAAPKGSAKKGVTKGKVKAAAKAKGKADKNGKSSLSKSPATKKVKATAGKPKPMPKAPKTTGAGGKGTAKATTKQPKAPKAKATAKTGNPPTTAKKKPTAPEPVATPTLDEDEEFGTELEDEETSSGPWVMVFLLFVLICVGAFFYARKKRQATATARDDFHYESFPEQAFATDMSGKGARDLDQEILQPVSQIDQQIKKPKGRSGKSRSKAAAKEAGTDVIKGPFDDTSSGDTDPDGGGGGKGSGKDGGFLGKIKGKASNISSSLKQAAKGRVANAVGGSIKAGFGRVGNIAGDYAHDAASSIGGDLGGAIAGNLTAKAVNRAGDKVASKASAKISGPGKEAPQQPDSANASKTTETREPPATVSAAANAHTVTPVASDDADSSPDSRDSGDLKPADWNGWDQLDAEEFWYRVYQIEEAGNKSDTDLDQCLHKQGFRDKEHFDRVKEAWMDKNREHPGMMQAMMNARTRQGKEAMSKAADPALFAPINGIDLKTYATIQARKASLSPDDAAGAEAIYQEFSTTSQAFSSAHDGWQSRMSSQTDPHVIGALMGEYGRFFAEAGQGAYGGAAQNAAGAMRMDAKAGSGPTGSEPCSFEQFVEIQVAQSVWANQGLDIGENLRRYFKLSILDYSNISAWWSQKYIADVRLNERYNELEPVYRQKWALGAAS